MERSALSISVAACPKRHAGGKIERDSHRGILTLVVDGQRRVRRSEVCKRRQWNLRSVGRVHIDVLQRVGTLPETWASTSITT